VHKKFSPFKTYTERKGREKNLHVELGIRCEVRDTLGRAGGVFGNLKWCSLTTTTNDGH